ncbi:MAG: hypothetical protein ACE5IW_05890 [bacterium]
MQCYNCGATIDVERQPLRNATCSKCASYLHCCRNCRFYDPAAHNQCREPQAEWVNDKEAGNFCDYFEAAPKAKFDESSSREEALRKLNELFKKK